MTAPPEGKQQRSNFLRAVLFILSTVVSNVIVTRLQVQGYRSTSALHQSASLNESASSSVATTSPRNATELLDSLNSECKTARVGMHVRHVQCMDKIKEYMGINNNSQGVAAAQTNVSNQFTYCAACSPLAMQNDTTIVILSSLIPSHPSIRIINETIHSLKHLRGLPPTTPLILPVDGLPKDRSKEDHERLKQYIVNLREAFHEPHQQILVSDKHLHIGGNIKQAHDVITTKYIYLIQHDFAFRRDIHHVAMKKTMEEYPDILRCVRFNKRRNTAQGQDRGFCTGMETPVDHVNGIHFFKSVGWSDNNHFTTWDYYDAVLKQMGYKHLNRAPEGPMQNMARKNCTHWGQFIYGARGDPPSIRHMDGRHSPTRRY